MNKTKLLIAPLLAVPLLASCNNAKEYKIEIPDTNGVIVTPSAVVKGKDYVGTIKIATDLTDQLLPTALDKVTSGNKELQSGEYTYTLKEDKLTADLTIPASNIVGDVSIQLTLVDADPTIVTADEFNTAISFQGVEYMQYEGLHKGKEGKIVIAEFSPTIIHTGARDEYTHNDTYVRKTAGSSYEGIRKIGEDNDWEAMEPGEAEKSFYTPATYVGAVYIQETLRFLDITFDKFEYNSATKDYFYKATFREKEEEIEFTFKFGFYNKRLVSYDIPAGDAAGKALKITYDETPVVWPIQSK